MYDYGNGRAQLHTWLARGRSVRFLALSDVHALWNAAGQPLHPWVQAFHNAIQLLPPSDAQSPYSGLIVAGDLTDIQGQPSADDYWSAARKWNAYAWQIEDGPQAQGQYIYDGWGNHDMAAADYPPSGTPSSTR